MNSPVAVASPCVKVCVLDAAGTTCTGCLRTVDEIATWGGYTDAQRERVMAQLPSRRKRLAELTPMRSAAKCSRCEADFVCGARDPHNPCWCAGLPPVAPQPGPSCLCPACLAAAPR